MRLLSGKKDQREMLASEMQTKHLRLKLATIEQRIVEQRKHVAVLDTQLKDSETAAAKAEGG